MSLHLYPLLKLHPLNFIPKNIVREGRWRIELRNSLQLDLFADRTSTQTFQSNQLRLWLSSMAYVLMQAFRYHCLKKTFLSQATVGTIRLNLLKLGARITVSVRRIVIAISSSCPAQEILAVAHSRIQALPNTS